MALVKELHAPARKNYQRRHVDIRGLDETWQADIVDMTPYAQLNNRHKYLLTIIDIFSKFAWVVPMKRKTGKETASAMSSIFAQGRVPKHLHVDRGGEFYNAIFESVMKRYDINMYSTYSNLKASICERFNRTLKEKMWMQFSLRGNYKWIDILPDLVSTYNNTVHRTIGIKPKDVSSKNEKTLLHRVFKKYLVNPIRQVTKFKVGEKVRISKYKNIFEKGYTPNWTTEIFTINQVVNTNPVTYKLNDYEDQPIAGGFYEEELHKVKYPDIYLVEKVLKKRGTNLFVKWLGFNSSHNSWIKKSDL